MVKLEWMIDLQLFAEGAGASGASGDGADSGADAGGGEPQAALENPKRAKRNPLANVRYGRQPESHPADTAADDAHHAAGDDEAGEEDLASEWEKLKRGKFAKLYGSDVASTVQNRLKNAKASEDALGKLRPVIEQMAKKYGVDASDIDGLMARYTDDDALYEEEAIERGMDVSTLKQIKRLEAQNAAYQEQQQKSAQQMMFDQHIQKLAEQAERAKLKYPNFDLQTELQNPYFQRLTSPDVGIDAETAYVAVHRDDINQALLQSSVQIARQQASNAVQAGQRRPNENGTRRNAPGLDIRDDPSKWSRKDREEVRRRVARGEKIIL